jgi:hypothetical protein
MRAHDRVARFPVDSGLIHALAAPLDTAADFRERQFDKFADRAGLTGRQHEIPGSSACNIRYMPST